MAKRPARRGRKRNFLKDAFVPHKGNGRHPHSLRANVVLGTIAVVLFVEICVLAQTFYFSQTQTMTASVLPAVVADLTNQERSDNGLDALTVNPLLTQAAQDKANDMAAKGYFSHVAPDGTLPWSWFQKAGYNYQFAGENLAINFTDSQDVVNAWMLSPAHRANILKQDYTQIGIGIAQGEYQGQETTFVVEFFGTPEPASNAVAAAPKQAKPASAPVTQENPATVAPTTPVETVATTPVPVSAAAGTPQVLGTETPNPQPVSFWMKVESSPSTYATYLMFAIAAIFLSLLLVSFAPRTLKFSQHVPHPSAVMNGAALLAVIFGILIVNHGFLAGVKVDTQESQSAAAVEVTR